MNKKWLKNDQTGPDWSANQESKIGLITSSREHQEHNVENALFFGSHYCKFKFKNDQTGPNWSTNQDNKTGLITLYTLTNMCIYIVNMQITFALWDPDPKGNPVEEELRRDKLFRLSVGRAILQRRTQLGKGWCEDKYLSHPRSK